MLVADWTGWDSSCGFRGRPAARGSDCSSPLSRLDEQPVRFAVLAAMAESILFREVLFLRLGTEIFADLALLLDHDIAALGHGEGLLEQSEMIDFRAARMLERFKPRRVHEIRHFDPIDQESVLFDRVAHFVSVFRTVGRLRP